MKDRLRQHFLNFAATAGLGFILAIVPFSPVVAEGTFHPPDLVDIPQGPFKMGSDGDEREAAYQLDEAAYGHNVTRKRGWYDNEPQSVVTLDRFQITTTPITNHAYAAFLQETGHPLPHVSKEQWQRYGLIHPYERAMPYIWPSNRPPAGRETHPVVMVSFEDARAYARWLGKKTDHLWRLPTEAEWEKAARGDKGFHFPWGNEFEPQLLNSHDSGPFTTMPVGSFPAGASPYGLLDAAGQVFEWTSTMAGNNRRIVKGGSWDDRGCGVCRPAAHHGRPETIKHILIGFRLVRQ